MGTSTYFVFLCFGNESYFYECAFALLSLTNIYDGKQLPCEKIWIYTDNAAWFSSFNNCTLPIHFREVKQEELQLWQGGTKFRLRAKIETLKDISLTVKGNILYFDTDVAFTHTIDDMVRHMSKGAAYMHEMEGIVKSRSTPTFRKLDNMLRKRGLSAKDGTPLYDMPMWNSGVTGYNNIFLPSLPDEIIQFMDDIYPNDHSIRVIGQFSVTVKLLDHGSIYSALPYVLHYWNLRETKSIFASFFRHFEGTEWVALAKYSAMIQLFEVMMEKTRFENSRNLLQALLNKKWEPGPMDWDELKKQL